MDTATKIAVQALGGHLARTNELLDKILERVERIDTKLSAIHFDADLVTKHVSEAGMKGSNLG